MVWRPPRVFADRTFTERDGPKSSTISALGDCILVARLTKYGDEVGWHKEGLVFRVEHRGGGHAADIVDSGHAHGGRAFLPAHGARPRLQPQPAVGHRGDRHALPRPGH